MRNEATATTALRDVRRLLSAGTVAGLTDGQLLARFVGHGGEASEAAFAALIDRHGAMVWGVCRRILRDDHGAEDAFQATFLILVRRAATVRVEDSLGRWLYGVSRKVAARARSDSWRRKAREDPPVESLAAPGQDPGRAELLAVLDEEIGRLPERYRAAVVLCDLDGLSHEEAARQLGCAVGTIGSRLARGRHRLRERIARRGLAPCGGLLLAAESAGATVPPRLAAATVRAATSSVSMPSIASGLVSTAILTLVEGVTKSMIATRLKWIVFASMTLGVVAGGSYVRAIQESAPAETEVRGEKGDPKGGEPRVNDNEENHHEIMQMERELVRAKLEVSKWNAQMELAQAIVATNIRLNKRRPGVVSQQEMAKNEAEVRIAKAEVEIAEFDRRECEARLAQARLGKHWPERRRETLSPSRAIELPKSLARRLAVVEEKLDRILDRLGADRDAAAPPPRGKPER